MPVIVRSLEDDPLPPLRPTIGSSNVLPLLGF
jgi:hypothetical protein